MKQLLFYFVFFLQSFYQLSAQEKPTVFVLEIRESIDPRMTRSVSLALEEAENIAADYVIVDMNTYGGAVSDADSIRGMLLDFPKPVFVYINKNAASAGALISIACDSIYMDKGANIGAATVVNGDDGSKAPDKYQSYMRSMMRSTAEANGRNPQIAEAMVDEKLEVKGVSSAGQVITFTTSEAIKNGFCEAEISDIKNILERNKITDYQLIRYEKSLSEQIISLFLNPAVSSILILIILGGIYFELQSPGVGFPMAAAFAAAVFYFVPHYMNGLAEYWEIAMFIIGIVLIAAEVFVIPGFGIAGISGTILTFGGLTLVMINNDYFDFSFVPTQDLVEVLGSSIVGFVASVALVFFALSQLTGKNGMFGKMILKSPEEEQEDYTSNFKKEYMVGKTGLAHTVLRPVGKVLIDDRLYDAITRGSFIDKGAKIIVISEEGASLKVKEMGA